MKRNYIIIGIALVVIVSGIIVGLILGRRNQTYNMQQEPETTLAEANTQNEIKIITTSNMEVKTTPNTILQFQICYKECYHTITKKVQMKEEDVNKTEEDLQEKYRDWMIKEFTAEQIIFYQEQEGICNEHYVLRDENGYVAIYNIDSSGQENLKEITDIVINYLTETDKMELKEGIKIVGQENLNAAIEDYE